MIFRGVVYALPFRASSYMGHDDHIHRQGRRRHELSNAASPIGHASLLSVEIELYNSTHSLMVCFLTFLMS